uniref:Zinc finger protein 518A n=1 Tax=Chelonoidis abingdonii TaxID=106734 RepID=A0A8C0J026_CHEAB
MPSEKEQTFCDKKPTTLLQDAAAKKLYVSLSYGLKNVKIDLPKVNIPNEVVLKNEVDRFRKLFQCKEQTARKSLSQEKVNGSHLNCSESYSLQSKPEVQFEEEGLKTSAKILNFTCTKCRDKIRYSPNDLQKHFQLLHYGELPSYPCEMCNFSANDFQLFKQHRRIHRSTLVKCEICNDEHIYTLLDLTKHFTSKHCIDGHFQCEKCGFSTRDVGTFVQHIHRHNEIQYKCGKCHHVSFTKGEFQEHLLVHTGAFPFSCQYCNYSAPRKDYLLKHVIALHRDHLYAKDKLEKDKCEKRIVKTPAGLKLILRRYKTGASRKALWRRKRINNGNDKTEEQNAQVLRNLNKIQPRSEELNQSIKELHMNEEKDQIIHNEKHNLQGGTVSPTTMQYNKAEDGSSFGLGLMKNAVHGPTVLMVKNNKISVPANYSAKFMGFKMVDGKQHIVIKLLPTNKQNVYFSGQKSDGVKDVSADSLLQTADTFGLSSSATSHVTNQQTLKNNSLHSLTSTPFSFSTPSGKTKAEKQNNALSRGKTISQTIESPTVVIGKNATHLPMKPGSTAPPCDLVTKVGTRGNVLSWESCIAHSRPQVLSPTVTNTLHYDPMKMPFPKIQNGGVSNNGGPNHLYYPSVDSSNQGLLPFHNYSKIDSSDNPCGIWMPTDDKPKDFMSSKMLLPQNSLRSDSTASFSQSVRGLNPEKCVSSQLNINSVYGHVNTKNNSVSSRNQSKCIIDRQCFMEKWHGGSKQYLDTNINQVFENVAEKSKAENISDCANSSLMPKITSVFSLHSKQASNYLSPEVNQLLQDVLKVKSTTPQESHNKLNTCVKLHCDQSFSCHQTDSKTFTHLKDSTARGLASSSNVGVHMSKRELNVKCSTINEGICFGKERQAPVTSHDAEETDKLSRTAGVGTLLKTHTDAIITQQLVKDRMRSATQNPSSFSPVLPEQKKTLLVQTPPPGFLVPLHLANQPSLQVVSGKPLPSASSSEVHLTKSIPASFLLNKRPGMILTFSSGTLGTVANVTGDSSQILGRVTSKEYRKITVPTSKTELKNDSVRSVNNSSGVSIVSDGAVSDLSNSVPFKAPLVITNSVDSSMKGISSENFLPEHHGTVCGSLESVKQQEIPQKQPVYALLPDGRQAVFLKCMTPNKPVVQKHNVQENAYNQNCQPKKTGAMQQKLLLKIKTSTSDATTDLKQSVSNSVPSLQLDKMQSFKSPAIGQKQTIITSSDALFLPGRLMPANPSLASSNCVLPVEPVCSTKPTGAWSQKNKLSKVKPCLKQTGHKSSEAVVSQRNKNSKRKTKDDFQEPPRKKIMLHRRCKEKNQTEVVSKSSGPYRPRASKETVRTLKLLPFNSKQLVKCPRRNQPVVVLNHPDADVPEVVNVMKTITKFKGHVLKVSLSKRTIDALLESAYCNTLDIATEDLSQRRHRMIKPVSPVKERFVLKLTLKKTSKNNYQIVKTTSDNTLKANFSCWFCGRVFDNQDNWVGHGQRHLMEATRDWNSLV